MVELKDFIGELKKNNNRAWFNENKERDWTIQSSTTAQNAFGAAIDSCFYARNQYASLCISPIPVPSLIVGGGACHVYLPLVSK